MEYVQLVAASVVSLASTLLVVPPVRKVAINRNWVDRPDGERKLHRGAVVSVGGITILVGVLAGIVYLVSIRDLFSSDITLPSPFILGGVALTFAMGLVDDIRGLGFKVKLVIQFAAAYLLILGGLQLEFFQSFFPGLDPVVAAYLSVPITLFWVVGIVNATNLLDGLDGLAAGLTLIAFVAISLVYGIAGHFGYVLFAFPVIGALIGFLRYNFNPATIFMGNSGSYLLGYLLAMYSIQKPAHADPVVSVMIILVILGLPVLDTSYSILRRCLKGMSPFAPDGDHVHHRLVRRYSHRTSVMMMYGAALLLGSTGVTMAGSPSPIAISIFALVVVAAIICLRFLGYFPISLLRFRTNGKGAWLDGRVVSLQKTRSRAGGPGLLLDRETSRVKVNQTSFTSIAGGFSSLRTTSSASGSLSGPTTEVVPDVDPI